MTKGLSFSEAFWDADIVGVSGWDALLRRMKDGKTVCNDVVHFIKDRAKAEADYSKSLSNLAKKAGGKEETGRLGEGWRMLKRQTDKMATAHEEASANYNQLADELTRFLEEQKQTIKQWDDVVKKQIQSKKNEYQKTTSLKKSYENKCIEYNNAGENLKTALMSVTTKRADQDKASTKKDKCLEAMNNADLAYKSGTETLDAVRRTWENEMEKCCKVFQDLETNRIDFLRDKLWQCTNVDSVACVKHDESAESVRLVLEQCDVSTDLQEFIDKNQTGSKRPEPVLYENYYSNTHPSGPAAPARPQVNTLTRQGPMRPPQPILPNLNVVPDDGAYASVGPFFGKIPDDGAYASVGPFFGKSKVSYLQVIRDHKATQPSEMSVKKGDILEFLKPKNSHNLVLVKVGSRCGLVPHNCVEPFTNTSRMTLI